MTLKLWWADEEEWEEITTWDDFDERIQVFLNLKTGQKQRVIVEEVE